MAVKKNTKKSVVKNIKKPSFFQKIKTKAQHVISFSKNKAKGLSQRTVGVVERHPFPSFLALLALLFVMVAVGSFLRTPKAEEKKVEVATKRVRIFGIGKNPHIEVQATVEKTGVIKLIAQTAGVVQQVYKQEGQGVYRGESIAWLSTNYQGGSAPGVSRQMAARNLQFQNETYNTQKDIIAKQREVAEKTDTQNDELKEISKKSIDDTKATISATENAINALDPSADGYEGSKANLLASLTGLRNNLRTLEYQTNYDEEPTKLSDLQKDLALKSLDIQEKSLDLSRDVATYNLRLAQISESLMYPASPVAGTVERVYIKAGETVSPGTLIATITANETSTGLVAYVSRDVAERISRNEKSVIRVGSSKFELAHSYISTEPTQGQLHSVVFVVPAERTQLFKNEQSVNVELPLAVAQALVATDPFVPVDAVYQTESESYVYVARRQKKGVYKAQSVKVELGSVYGSYIEVLHGLSSGDVVILDRNVIEGDTVVY